MTSIKPPADSTAPPADAADASQATGGPEGATANEAATLDAMVQQAGGAAPAEAAAGAAPADAMDALVAEVRAGDLSVDAAIDRLVQRALGDVDANLDPAQRGELEGLLREALATDPTLLALREAAQPT